MGVAQLSTHRVGSCLAEVLPAHCAPNISLIYLHTTTGDGGGGIGPHQPDLPTVGSAPGPSGI